MASMFKDYSKRGTGLYMTEDELNQINLKRIGEKYLDGTELPQLDSSPGLKIIDPTMAGDGYWNFNKMSLQTQDVIQSLNCLEPDIQQLHQFDWSSGHAKGREGGLLISNMNMNYGGVGGKALRDTELTDGCIGDKPAIMFEVKINESRTFYLEKPHQVEGVEIIEHN